MTRNKKAFFHQKFAIIFIENDLLILEHTRYYDFTTLIMINSFRIKFHDFITSKVVETSYTKNRKFANFCQKQTSHWIESREFVNFYQKKNATLNLARESNREKLLIEIFSLFLYVFSKLNENIEYDRAFVFKYVDFK